MDMDMYSQVEDDKATVYMCMMNEWMKSETGIDESSIQDMYAIAEDGKDMTLAEETEKIGVGGLTEQIVAVTVTGEGEILSGTVSASEKEQLLNTRMEDYLNATASHALEKEIDITNSYRNLGADNRTWYFKYQNTPAAYEKDIKIQYLVKINWKSE